MRGTGRNCLFSEAVGAFSYVLFGFFGESSPFALAQFDAPLHGHVGELVHVVFVVARQFGGFGEFLEFLDEFFVGFGVAFALGCCFVTAPSWEVFVPELRYKCAGNLIMSTFFGKNG
jgi:hypothetical protein